MKLDSHRRMALSAALTAVAAVTTLAPHASAQPTSGLEQSVAVLEFYIGSEPFAKTPEYAQRVMEELRQASEYVLLKQEDARKALKGKVGAAAQVVSDAELEAIRSELKGTEDLIYSRPKKAVPVLDGLIARTRALAGSRIVDERVRELFFAIHMKLARAYSDMGEDAKLEETLGQMLRFLGTAKVSDDQFHPRVVEFYKETEKKLQGQRTATLVVKSVPDGAEVTVQGRKLGQATPVTLDQLFPGPITVQARTEAGSTGIVRVTLEEGRTTEVTVDVAYEGALTFGGGKFGLTFETPELFKQYAPAFAARIGKILEVDKVVLTGLVTKPDGRDYIEAYLVNVDDERVELNDSLYTKANVVSRNRVKQLAAYIGKGKKVVLEKEAWYMSWLGWTGVGVGVAGGVFGAVMYMDFESKLEEVNCIQGEPICKSDAERTALAGDAKLARGLAVAGFVIAGIGLVGGTVAFILHDEEIIVETDEASSGTPRLQALSPFFTQDGAGLGAAFSF